MVEENEADERLGVDDAREPRCVVTVAEGLGGQGVVVREPALVVHLDPAEESQVYRSARFARNDAEVDWRLTQSRKETAPSTADDSIRL